MDLVGGRLSSRQDILSELGVGMGRLYGIILDIHRDISLAMNLCFVNLCYLKGRLSCACVPR